jgi:hypothetical protein
MVRLSGQPRVVTMPRGAKSTPENRNGQKSLTPFETPLHRWPLSASLHLRVRVAHLRGLVMRRIGPFAVAAALVFASSATMAFDVQQGGKASGKEPPASAPLHTDKDMGANFAIPEPGKTRNGTEVRIPGLGKLGVLPKMDFGLELLYGATEPKRMEEPVEQPDDLTIRGTVKHRF